MAEDALKCFTTLLESIPTWIAELENIIKTATERQQELLCENQPAELPQTPPRNPSKSSSIRTRRSKASKDEKVQSPKADKSEPTLLRTQLPHMTPADNLRLEQRKRKTMSACSDRQSAPYKYRSRSMVVVYYDGDTQKHFENIVRAIGTSRNCLRRGKMSAKVHGLGRTKIGGNEEWAADEGISCMPKLSWPEKEDETACMPKVTYRSTRSRPSPASSKVDGTEVFDNIDGFLEKAQTLCERAAHQVLRDGDCGLEIKGAREHFADAQKLGEAELPVWQRRAEEAVVRERVSEERKRVEEEEDEKKVRTVYSSSEKLVGEDPFSTPPRLEVDLEPDDSDGGDDEQDFTYYHTQLSRPYMRSARLAAH